MTQEPGFISDFGLWTDDQWRQAGELERRLAKEKLALIRMAWTDSHGCSRAKAVTTPAFLGSLRAGYNINVATTTLDSANARTFSSFTRGGGMGLDEMTGSPNIRIVPDPDTFRVLPWAPGVGWVLCDEYFNTGAPYHFSPRHLLRRQLGRLGEQGWDCMVGLEVEWYLLKLAEELGEAHQSIPGFRGRPLATLPVEPGYSYHSESNMDLMQPVLSALADAFEALGLSLRSMENEWGPGQVECTFDAKEALKAADDLLLFRTATKQICRRMGYTATFMCRPALKGYYSSGWHLHQSLVERRTGRNLFAPEGDRAAGDGPLSDLGMNYLGGLMEHGVASTAFTTPTVNGYRRFRPNSLAPDRVCWAYDHRGAMLRVLGSKGDPAARIENRVGEPAANPYLYIASQVAAGLDGIETTADPGPENDEPYAAECAMLPASLEAALDALEQASLYRTQFGEVFMEYYLKLKRNELGRFLAYLDEQGSTLAELGEDVTAWEQNEYFDFF
ncbi:MAG: glutamine synthetase family protein [Alphaproteobacteria bacterium]|nr:glutamine synthetase family protein [Alphaproteobacteria bacterium]